MTDIDLNILRELRKRSASMAEYYGDTEKKTKQNQALVAAGLEPLHSESLLQWDIREGEEHRRFVECLDAVIVHFGGDVAEAA